MNRCLARRLLWCACFLLWTACAQAVEYATLQCGGQPVTVCRVNVKKERLQLFLRDEQNRPLHTFTRLEEWLRGKGQRLVWGMNAGMYHPDYAAVGLFVAEGKELYPRNTADADGNFFLKPNGIFVLTEAGAQVVETSQYPKLRRKPLLATQSGPMLVIRGQLHPKFRPGSESRLFRNGVGVASPDVAIFATTEGPVNFHDFATLFRDTLKCPDALFLDGTVSSLFSTELKRNDFRIPLGPLLGVTEPLPSGATAP